MEITRVYFRCNKRLKLDEVKAIVKNNKHSEFIFNTIANLITELENPNHDYYITKDGGSLRVFARLLSEKYNTCYRNMITLIVLSAREKTLYANKTGIYSLNTFLYNPNKIKHIPKKYVKMNMSRVKNMIPISIRRGRY